jgi:hypothetical protein
MERRRQDLAESLVNDDQSAVAPQLSSQFSTDAFFWGERIKESKRPDYLTGRPPQSSPLQIRVSQLRSARCSFDLKEIARKEVPQNEVSKVLTRKPLPELRCVRRVRFHRTRSFPISRWAQSSRGRCAQMSLNNV